MRCCDTKSHNHERNACIRRKRGTIRKNLELSGEENKSVRQTNNQFVTSMRRSDDAVRVEIVQSAINVLNERMNIEEDGTIHNLKKVLESKSPKDFIVSSRDLISQMFGDEGLDELVSDVCASWSTISELRDIALEDTGSIFALKLRKMAQAIQGVMKQFLASFLTLTPHSMATERAVSHYTNITTVRRTFVKQETTNGLMHVSLNGNGTAFYDPRPAVVEFLRKKERPNGTCAMNFTQIGTLLKRVSKKRIESLRFTTLPRTATLGGL